MASGLARIAIINPADGSVDIKDPSAGTSRRYIGLAGCAEAIAILQQQAEETARDLAALHADLREFRNLLDDAGDTDLAKALEVHLSKLMQIATR